MITQNLSTLKIHKLTKEQYERELAAGRIDENAIYLIPDDGSDIVIDDALSETSENPVQNKVVTAGINAIVGTAEDNKDANTIHGVKKYIDHYTGGELVSAQIDEHAGDNTHITADERTAWNNKVDKVSGKGLSTEDYTTAEKTKLAGIAESATKDEALTSAEINEVFGITITAAEEVGFS